MKLYCGIDPGTKGAIVFLDEDGDWYDGRATPMIGKEYDKHEMINILALREEFLVHTVLEDVHAVQISGTTSAFQFGRGKGLWEMALCAFDLKHTLVQPKAWQKEVYEGVPKQYKVGMKKKTLDTKATSLIAAKRLFPEAPLIDYPEPKYYSDNANNRKLKRVGEMVPHKTKAEHDGLVDALLMAEYCRRKFK